MHGILPYLLTSMLYAFLSWSFWRALSRQAPGVPSTIRSLANRTRYAILLPLILHTLLLHQSILGGGGIQLGVGNAVSAIVWLTVLIYWLESFLYPMEGLQMLVLPVAAVSVLLPLVFPTRHLLVNTELPAFKVHFLLAMLAYSLFTIAALHALLMDQVERRLHGGLMPPVFANLPPLLTMESLLFRILYVAFVLLTLTVASGILFSEELFGRPLQFNHKTVFAFLSWGIFAALVAGRLIYGWRGRIAVRWTLTGFAMLVLAYVGTKFVLEVILGRG